MEREISLNHEKDFNTADIVFAFTMLVCGFLYWNLIDFYTFGAGTTVFAVVIFAVSLIYLSKSGNKQNAGSLAFLILAGFSAGQFMLFDNQFIAGLNFIFLSAVFIYWICLSTNGQIDKKLSVYIIGDAFQQGISMPILNFGCCPAGIRSFLKDKKTGGILPALIGILLFLPLIVTVIYLLMSADFAFENFINEILGLINIDNLIIYGVQFVYGIPVAFYWYGLIYGNVKGRHHDKITVEFVDTVAAGIRIAPRVAIYSALTVFNIIYLIFFAVQATYLFSAFTGNLPEIFTYAEYARRGFFELCAIAGINLGVLIVSHLLVQRKPDEDQKTLRMETIIISLFTILLITTALSKMVMYIDAYGLTPLRLYTSWFLILLFFIFTVTGIRQLKEFNAAKVIITGFILLFMVLSYGNTDGLIAKYNIGRYEAGTLSKVDIELLAGLSDGAVPHIYGMYLRTNEDDFEKREQLASSITERKSYKRSGFRAFNLQSYRADKIRINANRAD